MHDHHVPISSKMKGPHTKAAFEDILIRPDHPQTELLMDYPLVECNHEWDYYETTNENYHESTTKLINDFDSELLEDLRSYVPTQEQ